MRESTGLFICIVCIAQLTGDGKDLLTFNKLINTIGESEK